MDLNINQRIFVANEAEGSCLSPGELIVSLFIKDEAFCEIDEAEIHEAAADQGIYRCASCGWWNEENDIYDPSICTDCYDAKQDSKYT